MPFGISSTSEVFRKKNIQTCGDIQGVYTIHDDMIIAGANQKEHDEMMLKVMKRAKEKNIVPLRKNTIQSQGNKYMGNILSKDGCEV